MKQTQPQGRSLHGAAANHRLKLTWAAISSDGKRKTTMKKATTTMKKRISDSKGGKGGGSPSRLIDARIKEKDRKRGHGEFH